MSERRRRLKRGVIVCIHLGRLADPNAFTAQNRLGRDSLHSPSSMKLKHTLTSGLLAFAFVAARAQDTKITVPGLTDKAAPAASSNAAAAAPAAAAFNDAQLVEEFGWFIGKRVGLTELEFTPAEVASLIKGISAAAGGKDSPYSLEKIGPMMDEFMQKKQGAYLAKLKNKNNAVNADFFTKLKENKNIVELPSGLRYEIVKQGDGTFPKPTETVKVHYTGTLIDGTKFDSSVDRNEPAEFPLDQVIPGWTEGIQKVSKGGKIKLYVPPSLAYGDDGRPGIPPSSTLIFDVELLDIKPTAPAAPAATPGKP
jgi:FKBP-type peptidyl-prolyl cis-trans isomerase